MDHRAFLESLVTCAHVLPQQNLHIIPLTITEILGWSTQVDWKAFVSQRYHKPQYGCVCRMESPEDVILPLLAAGTFQQDEMVECAAEVGHVELLRAMKLENHHNNSFKRVVVTYSLKGRVTKTVKSPLLACSNGHTEVVQLLLDLEPSLLDDRDTMVECLQKACEGGYVELFSWLFNRFPAATQGQIVNQPEGNVMFRTACANGSAVIVRTLLLIKSELIQTMSEDSKYTCFHLACFQGNMEVVEVLESLSPTCVDGVSSTGGTPLHYACRNGHVAVVSFLLRRAPQHVVVVDTEHKRTPLHEAVLMGTPVGMDVDVAQHKSSECVRLLVSTPGIDLTACEAQGRTALDIACEKGNVTSVALLLQAGHSLPSPLLLHENSQLRLSCFHTACDRGHVGVVKKILEMSATNPARIADGFGRSPLDIACIRGRAGVARVLLLELSREIDSLYDHYNGKALTPAHKAAESDHVDVLRVLGELAPKLLTVCDELGQTALHVACTHGKKESVKYLVESCPTLLGVKDLLEMTPQDVAVETGHFPQLKQYF